MRAQVERDLEYRISVNDFEISYKKLEMDRDVLFNRIEVIAQEEAYNLEEYNKKLAELT